MGDWLGTDAVALSTIQYRSFEEARDFVRRLGLKSQKEWQAYCRAGKRPPDIPATPARAYAGKGWRGFGDWLGTGTVAPRLRRYRPFVRARSFVRALGLTNGDEWRRYGREGQRPVDIPAAPWIVYAEKGWRGMGDWLGTGTLSPKDRSYRPFLKARAFVRRLGLRSQDQWAEYCRSRRRPSDIPQDPRRVYAVDGWISMGNWLGTERVQTQQRKYRSFVRARAFVRKLGLRNLNAWQAYCRSGKKPGDIPATPRAVYAETGWVNLGDWLGTGTVAPKNSEYRTFGDARAFVHQLRLGGCRDWKRYCESGKKPEDIPATPDRRYKGQGWAGWGDWFGTGIVAPYKRTYRAFADARAFAKMQNLKSNQQWREYCRQHQCPEDIPAAPDRVYRDKGWVSWGDWLGTRVVSVSRRQWRSFKDARRFARALRLQAQSEWRAYCRKGKRPSDIPYEPDQVYAGKGWGSWKDWLGTTKSPGE